MLQHAGNGGQIREIETQSVDFEAAGCFGDEWGVFLLETLSVAGEEYNVLNAFGGKLCSGVLEILSVNVGIEDMGSSTLPLPGPAPKTMRARVMMMGDDNVWYEKI